MVNRKQTDINASWPHTIDSGQNGGNVEGLKGFQKKYLRGIAHSIKPVVLIGQSGLTPGVIAAVDEALEAHELIKIKFNDFKGKDQKKEIINAIETGTSSEMVGMIGHLAIFYRMNPDPEKRKIMLPER